MDGGCDLQHQLLIGLDPFESQREFLLVAGTVNLVVLQVSGVDETFSCLDSLEDGTNTRAGNIDLANVVDA
jgi:hypothetical protein